MKAELFDLLASIVFVCFGALALFIILLVLFS